MRILCLTHCFAFCNLTMNFPFSLLWLNFLLLFNDRVKLCVCKRHENCLQPFWMSPFEFYYIPDFGAKIKNRSEKPANSFIPYLGSVFSIHNFLFYSIHFLFNKIFNQFSNVPVFQFVFFLFLENALWIRRILSILVAFDEKHLCDCI